MAVETIDDFQRHGSEVFVCVMDMAKAFDNVKHSTSFKRLIIKGIPAIFIRLLMVMHKQQITCVLCNGQLSDTFTIRNRVKQGAVLSPILHCLYIDDLFKILRKRKPGCWISGSFVGILGYADDLTLLSPTIDGLQEMVKTCEEYATEHNLSFSTHPEASRCKTKCLAFLKGELRSKKVSPNSVSLLPR